MMRRLIKDIRVHITPLRLYVVVSIVCIVAFVYEIIMSHGNLFEQYFFHDIRDTGMDFLHSIEYVRGRHPYEQFHTLYPPLANLMFMCLFRMVPEWICHRWPDNFTDSIGIRGTDLDLRTYQATMLLFILFVIVCAVLIVQIVQCAVGDKKSWEKNLTAWSVLFSYGMLYAFERGNIILVAWILTMFFLLYYNSKNPILRELAVLSLAVAAGIKLYPAIFGVLLLKRKSIFLAIRTVVYGLLSVILPCFIFKEGLSAIRMWIDITLEFGKQEPTSIGNSFQNILYSLKELGRELLGVEIGSGWFGVASIVVVVLCVFFSFFYREEWRKVLAITLAMVLFSQQADYIYILFSIPLLMLIRSENHFKWNNVVELAGMIVLTAPLSLFYKRETLYYPQNTYAQIVMVVLLMMLLIQFVIRLKAIIWRKNEAIG